MEIDIEKQIYQLAVLRFGKEAQLGQFHEEVGELMQAINKHKRKNNPITASNIAEEIADVFIMLNQLCEIYQNHDQVNEIKAAKLDKLSEKLGL